MKASIVLVLLLAVGAVPAYASTKISHGDAVFLMRALREAKLEVRLANMAASKTSDPDLKVFAGQMARNNATISRQLGRIARKSSLAIRKETSEDQNEVLSTLSKLKSLGFDLAYLRYVVEKGANDVGDYHEEIEHGVSRDLKNFAAGTMPVLQTEMKTANRIMEEHWLRLLFLADP